MPNYTPNFNLEKPLPSDFYDERVQNRNMDIIDAEMKNNSETADQLQQHINSPMPHEFTDSGVRYRWGFRVINGQPQFIYEEVV